MAGLLKLTRVTRISKIIRDLSVKEETKALFKIIQLTFYLFLYIHIIACLWWYIIEFEDSWIPPLNYIDSKVEIFLPGASTEFRYGTAMYYAVLILGGNELGPT